MDPGVRRTVSEWCKSWKEIPEYLKRNVYRATGRNSAEPHLDKMDDNRHFDSGGTQPSTKCMQRDPDALSIKSRVIRDHLEASPS